MTHLLLLVLLGATLAGCADDRPPADSDEPDLLLAMLYLQRFTEKTALAVEAGNWALADRYAHEMEEAAEMLVGAHKDDVDLGRLVETAFLPAHERLETAIRAHDREAYDEAMAGVVQTCNACHAAAGYGDVVIVVPADWSRPFPSQSFEPVR